MVSAIRYPVDLLINKGREPAKMWGPLAAGDVA